MSGMFETWLDSLVSALQEREKDANVVVVDWLSLAHQLYTDAVNNTQIVGKTIARLLDWLQVVQAKSSLCCNALTWRDCCTRLLSAHQQGRLCCNTQPRAWPGDGS